MTGIQTPIALLVFRRPDLTRRVWRAIAASRPRRLLVVADGPRPNHPDDAELCDATRRVTERIDWPCEVARHYAERNMGCAARMASGISWVFEQVDEAIILEDDCIPHPTFLPFCSELLERYRDDARVGMISGDNFQGGRGPKEHSYYFSAFSHIWGWATWRRSWRHFDLEMKEWPTFRDNGRLATIFRRQRDLAYWTDTLDRAHRREIDTWDYAWTFSCWAHGALTILPAENLVSNLGFDERATHTRRRNDMAGRPARAMGFPLRHPEAVQRDDDADERTQDLLFRLTSHRGVRERLAAAVRGFVRGKA